METQTSHMASLAPHPCGVAVPGRAETALRTTRLVSDPPASARRSSTPGYQDSGHGAAALTATGGEPQRAGSAADDTPDELTPVLLAEWLDKALAEIEAGALSQQQLCRRLRLEWHVAEDNVMGACAELENRLAKLDFKLLRSPGWFARIAGRDRHAGLQFLQQWQQVKATERRFNTESLAFVHMHLSRQTAVRKNLLDLEMDSRRLGEALAQAKKCLEVLSITLARSADADAALIKFADRAEAAITRLYRLNAATRTAPESIRRSAVRGDAIIDLMQWKWLAAYSRWQAGMRTLEEEIGTGERNCTPAKEQLKGRLELHRLIRQVRSSCAAYQRQEVVLLDCLASLAGGTVLAG